LFKFIRCKTCCSTFLFAVVCKPKEKEEIHLVQSNVININILLQKKREDKKAYQLYLLIIQLRQATTKAKK
jgi:hypothetical protein